MLNQGDRHRPGVDHVHHLDRVPRLGKDNEIVGPVLSADPLLPLDIQRRFHMVLYPGFARQLAGVIKDAVPDRDRAGGDGRLGDADQHLDQAGSAAAQVANVPLDPRPVPSLPIGFRYSIKIGSGDRKGVPDDNSVLIAARVAVGKGEGCDISSADGRVIGAVDPKNGRRLVHSDRLLLHDRPAAPERL